MRKRKQELSVWFQGNGERELAGILCSLYGTAKKISLYEKKKATHWHWVTAV